MKSPDPTLLPSICDLLQQNELPTDDLPTQDLSLFLVEEQAGVLQAVAGLERCGEAGLVRSVATASDARGRGYAGKLVAELERMAMKQDICELFLLTETAESYFSHRDYLKIERDQAPDSIRSSRQFSALCPDSATLMHKQLCG